jgi:hypothetical protein
LKGLRILLEPTTTSSASMRFYPSYIASKRTHSKKRRMNPFGMFVFAASKPSQGSCRT